jgi:tRNA(Ser,Leu) C12 N-acetylase TAN1
MADKTESELELIREEAERIRETEDRTESDLQRIRDEAGRIASQPDKNKAERP